MEIRELVKIIRKRWLSIVAFVLLGTVLGVVAAEVSPNEYDATSSLAISPDLPPSVSNGTLYQQSQYVLQRVTSYVQYVDDAEVLKPVITSLKLKTSFGALKGKVVATNPTGTELVKVTATAGTAAQAATLATAVGKSLETVIKSREKPADSVGSGSAVKITFSQATKPSGLTSPKRGVDIALGFLLGLIVGAAVAVGRERFDPSLRSGPEVEDASGVHVMGTVTKGRRGAPALLAASDLSGPQADAYRVIRDRLQLSSLGAAPCSLVAASAVSGEGRSVFITNLAVVTAAGGARVCLVEADMRRPVLGELLGLGDRPGLADVLSGLAPLDDTIVKLGPGDLYVLPAGSRTPDPAGLLGSEVMRDLASELSQRFDYVFYDCPPLLPVMDAAITAHLVDGVILVTQAGVSKGNQVLAAVSTLGDVGIPVVGAAMLGTRGEWRRGQTYAARAPQVVKPAVPALAPAAERPALEAQPEAPSADPVEPAPPAGPTLDREWHPPAGPPFQSDHAPVVDTEDATPQVGYQAGGLDLSYWGREKHNGDHANSDGAVAPDAAEPGSDDLLPYQDEAETPPSAGRFAWSRAHRSRGSAESRDDLT